MGQTKDAQSDKHKNTHKNETTQKHKQTQHKQNTTKTKQTTTHNTTFTLYKKHILIKTTPQQHTTKSN